jgi:hypothetical protein
MQCVYIWAYLLGEGGCFEFFCLKRNKIWEKIQILAAVEKSKASNCEPQKVKSFWKGPFEKSTFEAICIGCFIQVNVPAHAFTSKYLQDWNGAIASLTLRTCSIIELRN